MSEERPHVLLVTADQWPGDLLSVTGRADIDTPTLDQLGRNGIRFDRAYSECPICIPARRSLLTGTDARTHGDRVFQPALTRAGVPYIADVFRAAGWQTGAVGKLHVFPPRDRIGFEEVISMEEGRPQLAGPDDWEIWLADHGMGGLGHAHGMSNNGYEHRPWHLPEEAHPTVWLARQMCRMIQRRDPTRPGFWHLSFNAPHPPIVPTAEYLAMYAGREMRPPARGDWSEAELPGALQRNRNSWAPLDEARLAAMRRAFNAQCTLIDHQLRLVLGTLREQLLLDDTIVLFTSDHGDMLGDHGLFAKRLMYEGSARVPMLLMGRAGCERCVPGTVDREVAGLADVMPTLLDLAGIEVPDSCTGRSLVGAARAEVLYGESGEGPSATRMVTDGRWKLIWYPDGNAVQLFDLEEDPLECRDLSAAPEGEAPLGRLTEALVARLYGEDLDAVEDGRLTGRPATPVPAPVNRALNGQRGLHLPQPPLDDPGKVVGAP
jgi:arylsulfatase A-like enzyme